MSSEALSLYDRTLYYDISTADYYELKHWCERLGLDSSGTINELRKKLYTYYKVNNSPPSRDNQTNGKGNIITIEKADNLDYFTIEPVDENYVKISGDVFLKMKDEETGEIHIIKADTILFNFKENFLSAVGNIDYQLEGSDKTEHFTGNAITFNVENWEGLFDKGVSQEDKEIEDSSVKFYFKGDLINKTAENYVILKKGEITSCSSDDPHYKIKADKIWLLSGDEWAIYNGVLYVGRIPMLYIPGLIKTGDEIFFNPVFGYKDSYGYFLQTTTYLIGKKDDDQTSFSFLQSDEESGYQKLSGIFLTDDPDPSDFSKKIQDYGNNGNNYLKLLFDYYSVYGYFTALDGDLKELGVLDNLSVYTSLAGKRLTDNGTYLYKDDEGVYSPVWLSSYFYKTNLPFRYAFDLSTSLSLGKFNLQLDLPFYSDEDILSDYSARSETLDLADFVGLETSAEETTSSTTVSSYKWGLQTSYSPDLKFLSPYLKSLSISDLDAYINWVSSDFPDDWEDNTVNNFYYPDSIIFPSVSASISGAILPFKNSSVSETETSDEENETVDISLRSPWQNDSEHENGKNSITDEPESRLPEMQKDIDFDFDNSNLSGSFMDNSLSYTISPSFTNKSQYYDEEWDTPEDIDNAVEYSYQSMSLSSSLKYTGDFFYDKIKITNNVNFSGKYNQHYNMDLLDEDTADNYLLEDKESTNLNIKDVFTLKYYPSVDEDYFSGTNLSYNLSTVFYDYSYESDDEMFVTDTFQWDTEHISVQTLQMYFPLEIGAYSHKLTLKTTLPPVDFDSSADFQMSFGPSKTTLNTALSLEDDEFVYDPLTVLEKITFFDNTYLSNSFNYNYEESFFETNTSTGQLNLFDGNLNLYTNLIYDFENDEPVNLSAKLKLWDFTAEYKMANTYPEYFDSDSGWIDEDEEAFIPSSITASYETSYSTGLFWKNRAEFSVDIDSSLDFNLIEYTESQFLFTFALKVDIFEFMNLTISTNSQNLAVFRYFPSLAEETGVSTLSLFDDLYKSFNFFDVEDRRRSNFNLKNMNITLTHDLHDWDLNLTYSGSPYIDESGSEYQYDWGTEITISMKWKGIPEIKSDISIDNGEISF